MQKENEQSIGYQYSIEKGFNILSDIEQKGGPGSGSWEGPGSPRFAWEGEELVPVEKVPDIIFHYTERKNVGGIKDNGLKSRQRTSSRVYGRGDRVYFFVDAKSMMNYARDQGNMKTGHIVAINTKRLPNMDFFYDDRYEKKSIWVDKPIPKEAIIDISKLFSIRQEDFSDRYLSSKRKPKI